MVDRIVPATTADDITMGAHALGFSDLGLVKTEPFTQWVIEDRFAGARPDLAAAGVQLVSDVRPFERRSCACSTAAIPPSPIWVVLRG